MLACPRSTRFGGAPGTSCRAKRISAWVVLRHGAAPALEFRRQTQSHKTLSSWFDDATMQFV
jgi:hypothetical protein